MTPFGLKTPDNETLYSWHILPLPLYIQNEKALLKQTPGYQEDVTTAESFRLLKDDPKSKLILYFHGVRLSMLSCNFTNFSRTLDT